MNMTTKTELSKPKPRMNMVSISTSLPIMVQIPLLSNKYISRDINIGCPGRVHDARVFVNSEIFIKEKQVLCSRAGSREWHCLVKETQMPTVLLGDPAYPLKP